ncbi:MAG TPA: condensation domain-containing protein, partial [Pseudonocardiaceae bacterium]
MLWLGYLASPPDRRSGHTVVNGFELPPDASPAVVAAALDTLVARHESLRTTFHLPDDGEAFQVVHEPQPVPMTELVSDDDAEPLIAQAIAELKAVAFDLAEPGMVRATLVLIGTRPVHLLVAAHHVVVDGWSWGVLRRELDVLVHAHIEGVAPALPPVAWQPLDQAAAERSEQGRKGNAAALRYWEHQLAMQPDRVLPGGADGPSGKQHVAVLESSALATALTWLSARYRVVDSTLVLAAFGAVLGAVTGRERAIMMTMSSNRHSARTRDLVACLAQYTAVNLDLRGDPTFRELVNRAGAAVLTAYRHGHYDFQAMKALEREVADRRGVVFSQPAGVNFKRYADPPARTDAGPLPTPSTADTRLDVVAVGGSCARGVVLLSVRPEPDNTTLELLCDGEAMAPDEMAGLVRAMETLLLAGMADPDLTLSALPALAGLHPPAPGADWALVDDCWVR